MFSITLPKPHEMLIPALRKQKAEHQGFKASFGYRRVCPKQTSKGVKQFLLIAMGLER